MSIIRLFAFGLGFLGLIENSFAILIDRSEVLRAAYLSRTAYFFDRLKSNDEKSIPSSDVTLFKKLIPAPRTLADWVDSCDGTSICGLDLIAVKPTLVLAAWTIQQGPENQRWAEITFAVRGTANFKDACADLTLTEIYNNQSFEECNEYHNQITAGLTPPCHLSRARRYLPEAPSVQDPIPGAPVHHHNSVLRFFGWTFEQQLAENYLLPIGDQISQYLQSDAFFTHLLQLGTNRVGRLIFTGDSLGGLLARILTLNYTNSIGGFDRTTRPRELPDFAESIGFSAPGLPHRDYNTVFRILTHNQPGLTPLPLEPEQHYLVGHKQDLIYGLGHIYRNSHGQLVHEPQGSSLLLSLPQSWFQTCLKMFPATSATAIAPTPLNHFTQSIQTHCLRWLTGVQLPCFRPHDLAALIKNLERIPGTHFQFHVADGSGTRAIPVPETIHED